MTIEIQSIRIASANPQCESFCPVLTQDRAAMHANPNNAAVTEDYNRDAARSWHCPSAKWIVQASGVNAIRCPEFGVVEQVPEA